MHILPMSLLFSRIESAPPCVPTVNDSNQYDVVVWYSVYIFFYYYIVKVIVCWFL